MPLRLGTRASALAQWQAEWVAARLQENGVEVALIPITTTGDRLPGPIEVIGQGGQGVFTKEIQRALLDNRIDLAVHSLKDLPTGEPQGLVLAAVPERGPVADVLVMAQSSPDTPCAVHEYGVQNLPEKATIGTGSLRRRTQLLHIRGDLEMKDIRGNVETRLRKLEQGDYDALILAEAGLRRLGLERYIATVLPLDLMLSAIGQGALALETRADDQTTRQSVASLDHWPTHLAVLAERAMLSTLEGGCLAPIAALGRVEQTQLTLTGRVMSRDGGEMLEAHHDIMLPPHAEAGTLCQNDAEQLGRQVAESLLAQGAKRLIDLSRGQ